MTVPTIAFLLRRLPPTEHLASRLGIVSVLVFGCQLSTMWGISLALRLPFRDHLLCHTLSAARLVLTQGPALCQTPFINVSEGDGGRGLGGASFHACLA